MCDFILFETMYKQSNFMLCDKVTTIEIPSAEAAIQSPNIHMILPASLLAGY